EEPGRAAGHLRQPVLRRHRPRRRPAARIRPGRQGQQGLLGRGSDRKAGRGPRRTSETDRPDRRSHARTRLGRAKLVLMAKLKAGDPAPDFELPGTGGKTYRLSDYRGKKLILAFYPGDFTAVC